MPLTSIQEDLPMIRAVMMAAALVAGGLSGVAQAQQVINQGEQFAVYNSPSYTGNVVGGGEALRVTGGESPVVTYSTNLHSAAPPGIPFQPGGHDNDVVYLLAPQAGGPNMAKR
jgi:hypothetical protein